MKIGSCPVCGAEIRVGTDMTNADRIRVMTDEELAEWLSDMHDAVTCPNGGAINCNPSCKRCWLNWLKEGVDDANE